MFKKIVNWEMSLCAIGSGLAVSCGLLSGCVQWGDQHEPLHPDTPRFTAEQVLNNDMPGRKASPVVKEIRNTEGLAKERFYNVPAAGVHPRIFFSPEDLPRIRQQLKESKIAAGILQEARERNDKFLDPGKWGGETYHALADGDMETFKTLWQDERNPAPSPIENAQHEFYRALTDEAFFALLDADEERGEKAANAVENFIPLLLPLIEEVVTKDFSEHYTFAVRGAMAGAAIRIALMYDFAQPFMTSDQADIVREVIATAIKDRYTLGMDLPRHWRRFNLLPQNNTEFVLLALAIEGEPGYDERIFERGSEVARDYVLYGNSQNGIGVEAMGYHTAGMRHNFDIMLAMANRGKECFSLVNWRNMFEKWMVYAMQPFGGEFLSSGDLGNFGPDRDLVAFASYLYPENPNIAWVKDQPGMRQNLGKGSTPYLYLLCPPDLPLSDGKKAPENITANDLELPLTLFDEERGMLYARTGWGENDLSLTLACRSDTAFHSHDHSDRGTFYLSALGQSWAATSYRMTETKYSNLITIDGRGQGYFPPPGKWLGVHDTPDFTLAAVDNSYCYNWQWISTCYVMSDAQIEQEPWLKGVSVQRDLNYQKTERLGLNWERDPSEVARNFYEGYMIGNPRMWYHEGGWVLRAQHYPVQRSFRTLALKRGKHPYVLIVDDIQKDDVERLYEWRMKTPSEIEVYGMDGNDIILGRIGADKRIPNRNLHYINHHTGVPIAKQGQALLLVRVLQANQPESATFQDNPRLETVEFIKHDDTHQFPGRSSGIGKRLVIPSRSIEPDYKILLFPHRHGDPLPITVFAKDGKTLTVEWSDQKDVYQVNKDSGGLTHLNLQRE